MRRRNNKRNIPDHSLIVTDIVNSEIQNSTTQDTTQDTTKSKQRDKLIYDIYQMTLESHWRQTWMYRLFGFPRSQGWSRQYYKIVYQHYHDLVE